MYFSEQAEARRNKNKQTRKRREERLIIKRKEILAKMDEHQAKDTTANKDEK